MKPVLITIRGSPASGKSTLARNIIKHINGKVALLIVDEFRYVMTAHEDRDKKDYDISFDNFIYNLKNYLSLGYTIIAEDAWIKKNKDVATSIEKVVNLAKEYDANIHKILLKGSFDTIKHLNNLRPMVIARKELQESYNKVYSKQIKNEIIICVDNKNPQEILKEAIKNI